MALYRIDLSLTRYTDVSVPSNMRSISVGDMMKAIRGVDNNVISRIHKVVKDGKYYYKEDGAVFVKDKSEEGETNFAIIQRAWNVTKDGADPSGQSQEEQKEAKPVIDIIKDNQTFFDSPKASNFAKIRVRNGTRVYFKDKYLSQDILLDVQPIVFNPIHKFSTTWSGKLRSLYSDEAGYSKVSGEVSDRLGGSPAEDDVLVYIFAKSLGRYIDISKYVISCSTSINKGAGNFSINLSSVDFDAMFSNESERIGGGHTSTILNKDADLEIPISGVEKIFQRNDLVFIKFETFKNEVESDPNAHVDYKNYNYDMIGVISDISSFKSPDNNTHSVTITGGDFRKVLAEDMATVSFLVLRKFYSSGSDIIDKIKERSKSIKRLEKGLSKGSDKKEEKKSKEKIAELEKENEDAWVDFEKKLLRRMADIQSKDFLQSRNLAAIAMLFVFAGASATVASFYDVIRFYLSFFGMVPIVPDPLYDSVSYKGLSSVYDYGNPFHGNLYDKDEISTTNFLEEGTSQEEGGLEATVDPIISSNKWIKGLQKRGIWRIVKLLVDETTARRRVVHSHFNLEQSSAYSILMKFVNPKFVEFYCDVYGKNIYLIFRKPPFDKLGYTSAFTNPPPEDTSPIDKMTITIPKGEVESDALSWETDVYSWFRLEPLAYKTIVSVAGVSNIAINIETVLNEYVTYCGNRALVVQYPYIPAWSSQDENEESKKNVRVSGRQLVADMVYLVESHQYLPFSRKGSITIHGDRRIKIGTFIYYELTGEMFYVVSVTNSYSKSNKGMKRSTKLEVVRGLVRKHIDKYFNIVNLKAVKEELEKADSGSFEDPSRINTLLESITVNTEGFKFFAERNQFTPGVIEVGELSPGSVIQ